MKKLLVVALATLGMVACVNENVLETPKSDVIAFGNAYIDNATRPAQDPSFNQLEGNLDAFNVWAFMNSTNGPVFEGEKVTKNGNVWGYDGIQYWSPEKNYYFAALAPVENNHWDVTTATGEDAKLGLGLVTFTNEKGTEDLIYAKKSVHTPAMSVLLESGMEPVKMQFQHLLSKVKFTFTNGFTTGNAGVVIENITMKAPGAGEINLAQADYANEWDLDGTDVTLEFGDVRELAAAQTTPDKDECQYERLSIPADATYEYEINFTVKLYHGTELAATIDKVSTVSGVAFEMGKAYNLTATITPENLELLPIEFEVEIDDWKEPTVDVTYGDYVFANGVANVSDLAGLAAVAADINEGEIPADVDIVLTDDLDLSAVQSRAIVANWTPIGTGAANPFTGTFDGNGYTIKNFKYTVTGDDEAWYVGLFGYAKDATIKNLVMENVTITSEKAYFAEVGAVVGHLEGNSTLENITIKGDVQIAGCVENVEASRIGGVVGGNAAGTITVKNVHVIANEGSYVKGGSHVGGIAGQLQVTNNFENCSTNIDVTAGRFFAGGIIGCAGLNDTYTNCHSTGNVAVVAGRSGNANDLYRTGGIAGGWNDAADKVLTVNNCSYTGNVSGASLDGSVAEPLDYAGYVGRGFTLKNCEGSKVVIDGTEYVQVGNGAPYGNYTINGLTPVYTADELVATLAAGNGAVLAGDLTDVPVTTTAPYGNSYGVALNGGVFDGDGHVLDFDKPSGDHYGIMTSGGTIKNVAIGGVFRGIVLMSPTEDVYVDNVVINDEDVCYAINTAEGDGTKSLYVSNSTIAGWTSIGSAVKYVEFTNCTFAQGTYYTNVFGRLVKPYVNAVFENCEFGNKYYIDLSALGANQTVTLKNCTVNGVQLTAENWTSLVAPEDDCQNGQISIELKNGTYMTATNVADYVVIQ